MLEGCWDPLWGPVLSSMLVLDVTPTTQVTLSPPPSPPCAKHETALALEGPLPARHMVLIMHILDSHLKALPFTLALLLTVHSLASRQCILLFV